VTEWNYIDNLVKKQKEAERKNKYGGLRLTVLFYRIFKNAIKNLL